MTDIIMQSSANDPSDELYLDDESHPIPQVSVIDGVVKLESGGLYNGLVIASPLGSDYRSQKRLLRKIENYVGDIAAQREEVKDGGIKADALDMRIYVSIHPDSAPEILALLEKCRPWVEGKNIAFIVDTDLGAS
jgi:hypothetical protein